MGSEKRGLHGRGRGAMPLTQGSEKDEGSGWQGGSRKEGAWGPPARPGPLGPPSRVSCTLLVDIAFCSLGLGWLCSTAQLAPLAAATMSARVHEHNYGLCAFFFPKPPAGERRGGGRGLHEGDTVVRSRPASSPQAGQLAGAGKGGSAPDHSLLGPRPGLVAGAETTPKALGCG